MFSEALSHNVHMCVSVCGYTTEGGSAVEEQALALVFHRKAKDVWSKVEERTRGWGGREGKRDDREGSGGPVTTTTTLYLKMSG